MSTTPEPVDTRSSEVTYMGRRQLSTGKVGYAYTGEDGSPRYYKAALVAGAQIGQRITMESPVDEPDVYYSKGPRAPRVTGFDETIDRDTLTRWQIADRAAYQAKADADASNRAAKQAAHMEHHIEALAAAARNLSGPQRAAFARYVEDRIRGW
jgi:hypothetical protein